MAEAKKTPAKTAAKPKSTAAKAPAKKPAPAAKAAPKPATAKAAQVKEEKVVAPKVKAPVVHTPEDTTRNLRKTRIGKVVSDKMDKTIVVLITEKRPHPLYKKTVTRSKKFKAHDENNECGVGDTVEIMETRKLSKNKYFRLLRVIEKAK